MDQTPDTPKPARQSRWRMLITPWRWSRWTWAAVAPLMLAAYFLSAVPLDRLAKQRLRSPLGTEVVSHVYLPVFLAQQHSNTVAAVLAWEHGVMDRILGEQGGLFLWSLGDIVDFGGEVNPADLLATDDDIPADALVPMPETVE